MPKEKILIIDDEADFRETLKSILSKKYSPILASNGKEGLNILEEETISLVLLDLRMPKMDGIEVLKKIPTSEIPVIIVSAKTLPDEIQEGLTAGANAYLTKPVKQYQLYDAIAAVMGVQQKTDGGKERTLITAHSLNEATRGRFRILLVEDNLQIL